MRVSTRKIVGLLIGCAAGAYIAAIFPMVAHAEVCPNARVRIGPSENLPDCRAYEMVSPVAKGGFDALSRISFLQNPAQASPTGEVIAYQGNSPFAGASSSLFPTAHLSTRTSDGWQTSEISPPTPQATLTSGVPAATARYNFSEDLSQVVLQVPGQALTTLPAGNEGLLNLFLRRDDGSYSLVNSVAPSEFAPEGAGCHKFEACFQVFDRSVFAGASSDFTHVIFETNDSLVGTGAPGGFVNNLYENSDGHVHAVGMLPDKTFSTTGAVAGAGGFELYVGAWSNINHAMSANGTRVLFEAVADGGEPDPIQAGMTELYDRLDGMRTIEVSAPAKGATPTNPAPEPAQFWAASTDGSKVLFTSSAELTSSSNTGPANNSADLYRYDVNAEAVTDLTLDTNPADASTGAGVKGVVGSSSDGSYVYFVADGQLMNGQGVDGQPNLYVWHEDTKTSEDQLEFIATLSAGDSRDWTARPFELQAYLAPDGGHLVFMSLKSLTGYENVDRYRHEADSEVFEYSAATHTLACVSCDRSGANPVGSAFIGATPHFLASTPFHQPRVLSDDGGRVFFSSQNPLVTGDTSISAKIYEYEQDGVGSCQINGGCRYLISSGTSGAPESEDVFLDADATGENVFFATLSRLAPTDADSLFDVYDARVGGGFGPPAIQAGCAGCTSSTPSSLPAPQPASQLLLAGVTKGSGNLAPPSGRGRTQPKKPFCQAKAKRIKNANARARALRQCPRMRKKGANRRLGR